MGVDPVPASAAPAGSDAFRLGAIQQPGILLVLDRDSFQVVQAAGDTAGVFGIAVTEVLQRDIAALIPP